MKPDLDNPLFDPDADIRTDDGFWPSLWETVLEAAVVLAIFAACIAAVALSGCGGSTAEDETKSTQPVVCPSDRSNCI